eukprot:scaffold52497_cov69-Phaeocystis_antarctica.AAC.5
MVSTDSQKGSSFTAKRARASMRPTLDRAARRWPRSAARPPTRAPGAYPLGAPRAARASPSQRVRRQWWRRAARCGSGLEALVAARRGGCRSAAPRCAQRPSCRYSRATRRQRCQQQWREAGGGANGSARPQRCGRPSISSNAPAPRASPLHRTSSGAARAHAKATSAGVASAMCAERSSTRHAVSVGRSARRRVDFSTPIAPASRADGSANGGGRETAMSHGKARRRNRSATPPPTPADAAPPSELCSS